MRIQNHYKNINVLRTREYQGGSSKALQIKIYMILLNM